MLHHIMVLIIIDIKRFSFYGPYFSAVYILILRVPIQIVSHTYLRIRPINIFTLLSTII